MVFSVGRNYIGCVMPSHATEHQRDLMRSLYKLHNGDQVLTCAAYARAEANGQAYRKRGSLRMPPEDYARALLEDGLRKGWLTTTS